MHRTIRELNPSEKIDLFVTDRRLVQRTQYPSTHPSMNNFGNLLRGPVMDAFPLAPRSCFTSTTCSPHGNAMSRSKGERYLYPYLGHATKQGDRRVQPAPEKQPFLVATSYFPPNNEQRDDEEAKLSDRWGFEIAPTVPNT